MTHLQAAFDLLGVSPDSDATTVKKAWRGLVRSYHPDTARTDRQQANRRLAEINAAFDAVSASIMADRNRRKTEAMERIRQMAEAAERERLEALGRREAAQQAAARAALTEPAKAPVRAAPRTAAEDCIPRAGRADAPSGRQTDLAIAEDGRALAHLAQKAATAFRLVQLACSRERKVEPRSVYL